MRSQRSWLVRLKLLIGLPALFSLLVSPLRASWQASGTLTSTKPARQPPYYRGDLPPPGATGRLPVELAPLPPGIPESWLPVAALERLVADMDAFVERSGVATVLNLEPETGADRLVSPTVYLGCALDTATDECSEEERANVLSVTSGTKEWRRALSAAALRADVGRALVVQLQIAPHWIRQRGVKGAKEVRLGTDSVQPLPWLTSLDTPVWVVQVTGAVVDDDGKIVRSGAEGIWALRTPFKISALRAQQLLSDEDVESVRQDHRRSDLPGSPLRWEVALQQLLAQLTGLSPRAPGSPSLTDSR